MRFQILVTEEKTNGRLYKIEADDLGLQLLLTWHSLDRITVWGLNVEQVLEALLYPEEVVIRWGQGVEDPCLQAGDESYPLQ